VTFGEILLASYLLYLNAQWFGLEESLVVKSSGLFHDSFKAKIDLRD